MRKQIASLLIAGFALWFSTVASVGQDAKKKKTEKSITPAKVNLGRPVDFERDIFPILDANCIACHNLAIKESKLNLEEVPDILKGGKRGPAIIAKDPDKSLLYKVASRSVQPSMPPLPNKVEAAALTPKELGLLRQWILEGANAGAGSAKEIVQWQPLPDGIKAIFSVAVSPWGRLAAAGRANQISVYDIGSGLEVAQLTDPNLSKIDMDGKPMYPSGASHRDFVHSLAFSPDGTILASGGYRVVKLWQRSANAQKLQMPNVGDVSLVAINADGTWAALAAADNSIKLWNLADGKPGKTLTGHSAAVTGLRFSPSAEEKVQIDKAADAAYAAVQAAVDRVAAAKKAVANFDPKKEKLDEEKTATKKKQLTDAIAAAEKAVTDATAAARTAIDTKNDFAKKVTEQSILVSSSQDKSLRVWNLSDGKSTTTIETSAPINALALNKDATQAIAGHADNAIRVWSLASLTKEDKAAAEGKKPAEAEAEAVKPIKEIPGHSKPVTALELIWPAGTQFVSGSEDATVRTWDLAAGRQIRSINHGGPVTSVAARSDGTAIASAGAAFAKLWDMNGKQLAEMKGNVTSKRQVATVIEEQTVAKQKFALSDAAFKAAEKNLKDRKDGVKKATTAKAAADKAFTEADKKGKDAAKKVTDADAALKTAKEALTKATATRDAAVKKATDDAAALKTATAAKAAAAKKATDTAAAAKNAKEEKAKADAEAEAKKAADALAAADKTLAAADAANKTAQAAKTKSEADFKSAETKSKAATTAKTNADKAAAPLLDAAKKAKTTQDGSVRSLKLAEKSTKLADEKLKQSTANKEVATAYQKKVDAGLAELQKADKETEKPIGFVTISPDGTTLASAGEDGLVHVFDAKSGKPINTLAGHKGAIKALRFGPNNSVISTAADKSIIAWDTNAPWKLIGQLGAKKDDPLDVSESPFISRVLALDFSDDGKFLATGGGDPSRSGELIIWDVQKQTITREFKDAHSDTVFGLEFSRDGKFLVSGAADKFVKTFDVTTGKHIKSFEGHTHHVLDVSWKADGSAIASAGADNAIKIWNVETGEQKRTITNYSKQVTSLQFVGVGENIISCGGDKTVRLHRTSNGQNYRSFSGGTDFMYSAASARDESVVVAGGEDGVLRIWNGANGQVLKNFEPPKPAVNLAQAGANEQAKK